MFIEHLGSFRQAQTDIVLEIVTFETPLLKIGYENLSFEKIDSLDIMYNVYKFLILSDCEQSYLRIFADRLSALHKIADYKSALPDELE